MLGWPKTDVERPHPVPIILCIRAVCLDLANVSCAGLSFPKKRQPGDSYHDFSFANAAAIALLATGWRDCC